MQARDSAIADRIAGAGLRRTEVRLRVLEVIDAADRPLSVQEVRERLGECDAVTLYRTLNAFEQKRLVHRVLGEGRAWRYAGGEATAVAQHAHVHFVCDDCGRVACLDDSPIPHDLPEQLMVDDSLHVTRAEVTLHGRCPACATGGRARGEEES